MGTAGAIGTEILYLFGAYVVEQKGSELMSVPTRDPFRSGFVFMAGAFFVAIGLIFNQWLVGALLSPDGSIESSSLKILIWLFDLSCLVIGFGLIRHRDRFHLPASVGVNLLFIVLSTILSLLLAEFVLRGLGFPSWQRNVHVTVEPGGRFSVKHHSLGHALMPGSFKVVLPSGSSFQTTHLSDGLRVTHPLETYHTQQTKDEIWVFGCSITYGWALNDPETYPWRMQEELHDFEVVNFGVNGYGTLQSFIQFREAIGKRRRPLIAVLSYSASFHDERNTLSRAWRKQLSLYDDLVLISHPYARIDREGKLSCSMAEVEYREVPFMSMSVLVNLLDHVYNKLDVRLLHSHDVSKAIIGQFVELATHEKVQVVVAGLTDDRSTLEMLDYCRDRQIPVIDISVDLTIPENTNMPYDPHPSTAANREYGRKLTSFLRDSVLGGPTM